MDVVRESRRALKRVDRTQIEGTVQMLRDYRTIFCVGNGGGYSHAAHFAADLRKICGIHAHSFDSMGELTARVNDQSWEESIIEWAYGMGRDPMLDRWFMFSVGGAQDGLSTNLPDAFHGIVGEKGAKHARIVIPSTSTPVIEGCQSVIAHHIVEQLAR